MATVVIAGASGVVGSYLIAHGLELGWEVRVLSRNPSSNQRFPAGVEAFRWRPQACAEGDEAALGELRGALEKADVLVNLAGEPLMAGRLGTAHRERVLESRVASVRALGMALRTVEVLPKVWLQASAVGYYGDRGEEVLSDTSGAGIGVLSEVCQAWEAEARRQVAELPSMRLCVMRLGLVMAPDADAWKKMSLPIRLGAGGPLGTGRQWYPWVSAKDVARAFFFVATETEWQGALNITAPEGVRQRELVQKVAAQLGRPASIPTPAFALRLALGKTVADEMILSSCRAEPAELQSLGYTFDMSRFDDALGWLLRSTD